MKKIWIKAATALVLAGVIGVAARAQTIAAPADTDQDGVPNVRDACLWTPRGAKLIAQGCSALDIAQFPEAFTAPLLEELDDVGARMEKQDELAAVLRETTAIKSLFEQAADEMRRGEVCRPQEIFASAQHRFRAARQALAEARNALLLSLRGQKRPREDADVNATDLTFMMFEVIDHALEASQRNAITAGRAFETMCGSVAGRAIARGKILKINDGRRRLQLEGVTAALAEGYRSTTTIAEGYVVDVSGYRFNDGTGVADSIAVSDEGQVFQMPPPAKCLLLRFAPSQSLLGPFTLLEPEAYQPSDGYSLEQGMGIGVKAAGCDLRRPGTDYTVQSLEVKLNYFDKNNQFRADYVMAADMDATDDPVWFPVMKTNYPATMILTWYWRDCPGGVCGAKKQLAKQSVPFAMSQRNHFCAAEYSTKVLTLDDQDQVNFQPVHVRKLTGAQFIGLSYAEGSQVKFRAETYRVLGSNTSTYPNVDTIETACSISDGKCAPLPFAVFNFDFYQPGKILSGALAGVSERAGLMWPRLLGTRNGKTFSYSCSVPNVVRDAVNKDDPYMWTFYRLPFYPGYSLWSMGQGNNGGFTHTGKSAYAFDFVAPIPSEIRAARGGIVVDLREYQTGNKYDVSVLFPNDTLLNQYCDVAKCHENWLLIRHEDGKETWYGHMIPNGVLPQKGQKVFRGEPIAYVGNTGYSTRPHLHFQQQDTTGYSLSSCFEATAPFASSLLIPCYIPKKGNLLFSNNQ